MHNEDLTPIIRIFHSHIHATLPYLQPRVWVFAGTGCTRVVCVCTGLEGRAAQFSLSKQMYNKTMVQVATVHHNTVAIPVTSRRCHCNAVISQRGLCALTALPSHYCRRAHAGLKSW